MREGNAAEIVDLALKTKPVLFVHAGDLPATAEAVRDLLAASGRFFDRGMPVRIVKPADGSLPSATPLTKHNVVIEVHRFCQPVKIDPKRMNESYGRFAWIYDPDGNKIELWEPTKPKP